MHLSNSMQPTSRHHLNLHPMKCVDVVLPIELMQHCQSALCSLPAGCSVTLQYRIASEGWCAGHAACWTFTQVYRRVYSRYTAHVFVKYMSIQHGYTASIQHAYLSEGPVYTRGYTGYTATPLIKLVFHLFVV